MRRPQVTLVTPHFQPETGAAARRCTALADELAKRGWAVTVISSLPHHPAMRITAGFDVPTPDTRVEGGVTVVRLRPRLTRGERLAERLMAEAWFAVRAARQAATVPTDVIVASSPYFFLGPAGAWAARRARRPFVWDVRDLTWLYPKAAGRRTFGLDRLFDAWMRRVARRCDALVTTSAAQLAHFGAGPRRSKVIPNGVTPEQLARHADPRGPRAEGPPRVAYVGLFGFMHGLGVLLDAAAVLPEFEFHLFGDGPDRTPLEAEAAARRLRNVRFHGHVDAAGVDAAYRMADVLVAPIRDREAFRMIQPAKLWEYLATGVPVIHAGRGEAAELLLRHRLAHVVPPEAPDALAAAVRQVIDNPVEAAAIGARGREWVAAHRDRSRLAADWDGLLRSVTGDG